MSNCAYKCRTLLDWQVDILFVPAATTFVEFNLIGHFFFIGLLYNHVYSSKEGDAFVDIEQQILNSLLDVNCK